MKTTSKIKSSLIRLHTEATLRIQKFFKNKPYVRIQMEPKRFLSIHTGIQIGTVQEINADGSIIASVIGAGHTKPQRVLYQPQDLPVCALVVVLEELERMKKTNLLKKP